VSTLGGAFDAKSLALFVGFFVEVLAKESMEKHLQKWTQNLPTNFKEFFLTFFRLLKDRKDLSRSVPRELMDRIVQINKRLVDLSVGFLQPPGNEDLFHKLLQMGTRAVQEKFVINSHQLNTLFVCFVFRTRMCVLQLSTAAENPTSGCYSSKEICFAVSYCIPSTATSGLLCSKTLHSNGGS
jgi:hypothetical protein